MAELSRRNVLCTAAMSGVLGSAGCLQALGGSTRTPNVAVSDTTLPTELEPHFKFDGEVIEPFSSERPGRIRLSFRYRESADTTRTILFGETPPFSYYNGAQPDLGPKLMAIPETKKALEGAGAANPGPDEWVPESPEDGCWRAPTIPQVDQETRSTIELSPGDQVSEEYSLLGFGQEDCLPAGEYGFGSYEPYEVSRNGNTGWQSADDQNWALEFQVKTTHS